MLLQFRDYITACRNNVTRIIHIHTLMFRLRIIPRNTSFNRYTVRIVRLEANHLSSFSQFNFPFLVRSLYFVSWSTNTWFIEYIYIYIQKLLFSLFNYRGTKLLS